MHREGRSTKRMTNQNSLRNVYKNTRWIDTDQTYFTNFIEIHLT